MKPESFYREIVIEENAKGQIVYKSSVDKTKKLNKEKITDKRVKKEKK